MKKKILILLTLIVVTAMTIAALSPKDVYAVGETGVIPDIGGGEDRGPEDNPSTGTGGEEPYGTWAKYDLGMSNMIRVSIADITGNYPEVKAETYYLLEYKLGREEYWKDSEYNFLRYFFDDVEGAKYNIIGPRGVCVSKYKNNSESDIECYSVEEHKIIKGDGWFLDSYYNDKNKLRNGLNYSVNNTANYLSIKKNFEYIINNLQTNDNKKFVENLIGEEFNLDERKLNTKQKLQLSNYRLIIEPVYGFKKRDNSNTWVFATIKGMAAYMLNKSDPTRTLGIPVKEYAEDTVASNTHGSINKNGIQRLPEYMPTFLQATEYPNYYKKIANVNEGYGYGIYKIVGGCNPKIECCYDNEGIYQEGYSERDTEHKDCTEFDEEGKCIGEIIPCITKEETPQCDEPSENIVIGGKCQNSTYEQTINKSIEISKEGVFPEYDYYPNDEENYCTNLVTKTITAEAKITQTGFTNFNFSPANGEIEAGRYFTFTGNYLGEAYYNICDDKLNYTIIEYKPKYECPELGTETIHENGKITEITYNAQEVNSDVCKYNKTTTTYIEITGDDYENSSNQCSSQGNGLYLCVESTFNDEITEQAIKKCEEKITKFTKNYDEATEEEKKEIATEMTKELKSNPSILTTLAENSNDSSDTSLYEWESWIIEYSHNSNKWYPGTGNKINYSLTFNPNKACINKSTYVVRYIPNNQECDQTAEIEGNANSYYNPLIPDENEFPIKVIADDISIIKDMTWNLNYTCGVNCSKGLITPSGTFDLIYRPINMNKDKTFPNRNPGSNWVNFMNDYNNDVNSAKSKLTRNQLEYSITLDQNKITQIKEYNQGKLHTDMSTISIDGTSSFLTDLGITRHEGVIYNKLGECSDEGENKCWGGSQ